MPPVHPAATIFPMLDDDRLRELANDIKANGLREPVVMLGAQLLDGRNRWRACELAGVEPRARDWSGPDPVAYVVSLNLHRRHLDESQRSMVAGRIATLKEGRPSKTPAIAGVSESSAAALLSVSEDSVGRAKKVLRSGTPELVAAVEQGAVAVSTAADLATLPREQQREVVARGEREILEAAKKIRAGRAEERRQERVEKIVEIAKGNRPLAAVERFPLLLADPPWRYEHVETESRAIENQYPTMSLDEIRALPVTDVTTEDCVLFLWATSPKLAESMSVIEAWGFTYRTCAVWVKDKIGMGYYFRQRHELLLVATKGAPPVPAPADRLDSVLDGARLEHSAKPVSAYEAIERMYPRFPKLEMFCRSPRAGWEAWGNQS